MFNIIGTIVKIVLVTIEICGLSIGVYMMLFQGSTNLTDVGKALEGKNPLIVMCGYIGFISMNLLMLAIGLLGPVVRKLLDRSKNKKSK